MRYQPSLQTIARKINHILSSPSVRSAGLPAFCSLAILVSACNSGQSQASGKGDSAATVKVQAPKDSSGPAVIPMTPVDTALYNKKIAFLANGDSSGRWPVRAVYPNAGAILPFKRIVAYYGNLYSKNMGILGEYPPDEMLKRLKVELKKWQEADPATPVIPALHYIAVTAQGSPGKDGKYRLRMPFKQIDSILHIAERINALVFLDVQVGFSNVQAEIPQLEKYLKMPHVHLGIDPEFSMKTGKKPGTVIGTMDATDVNFVSNYLAGLVKANNLPPKILVVHRFTRPMITNYKNIQKRPEVQLVVDMDGWGEPTLKYDSYKSYVSNEPVQFTGFKLFYKNDIRKPKSRMLTPPEVLKQKPSPIYIQYQ
ncbi:hypothetical protein Q4E93_32045 [Flavitalea sp. BT771]|uniref:hypothetical protein n=1 Tax=Flavitalea sp. BT771 TaxID=3063329 RepID=UPI0026E22BC1|nr:hypothetical protein [Flavitalea sp. BT771]MDO6435292.1 hypothetical protein [Flavitalea sp. BT771]MDV6224348.1 hypothetical protein [Flavitalea sp. BT771]